MSIFNHQTYAFLFPHADDELYCSTLLKRLNEEGKNLQLFLVTNGDAGGNPEERKQEMLESLNSIRLDEELITFLDISELNLLDNLHKVYAEILLKLADKDMDAIISVDYEGGHEGHDSINFIAAQLAKMLKSKHYTYPIYHIENGNRVGLKFWPDRKADFTLHHNPAEKDIKIKIFEAHRSQIGHFLGIQKNQPDYFNLHFTREVYREFDVNTDYLKRPDYELGYESHRNGFKFEDFKRGVEKFYSLVEDKGVVQ